MHSLLLLPNLLSTPLLSRPVACFLILTVALPGSAQDIKAFYVDQHGLPAANLMERADVNRANTQDVYKFLRAAQLPNQTQAEPIEWNFSKYIVGRDGAVLGRYDQQVSVPFLEDQLQQLLA